MTIARDRPVADGLGGNVGHRFIPWSFFTDRRPADDWAERGYDSYSGH